MTAADYLQWGAILAQGALFGFTLSQTSLAARDWFFWALLLGNSAFVYVMLYANRIAP